MSSDRARADMSALSSLCSAKTRLASLENSHQEACRPLRQEANGLRVALKQWMTEAGVTCVPVTVRDEEGNDVQMYVRLQTSSTVKPIGDEVFRQAFDMVDLGRLRAAHEALVLKEQRRRKKAGEASRQVTVEDVWTAAIEEGIRELNTSHSTGLTITTTQERTKRTRSDRDGVPRPPLLPSEMRQRAQRLYDIGRLLSSSRDAYTQARSRDDATVEAHTAAVAEFLKRENPKTSSKRVNLRQAVPSESSDAPPATRSVPCVVKCQRVEKVGEVRITDFKRRVRTTLEGVFRGAQPSEETFRAALQEDRRRDIYSRLLSAYTDLRAEKTVVRDTVDLEFQSAR